MIRKCQLCGTHHAPHHRRENESPISLRHHCRTISRPRKHTELCSDTTLLARVLDNIYFDTTAATAVSCQILFLLNGIKCWQTKHGTSETRERVYVRRITCWRSVVDVCVYTHYCRVTMTPCARPESFMFTVGNCLVWGTKIIQGAVQKGEHKWM